MFILAVRNSSNQKAVEASYLISSYFDSQGIDFAFIDSDDLFAGIGPEDSGIDTKAVDMAVVLGGDGTILRTARFLHGSNAPILGINFGNLGFLANRGEEGVLNLIASAFAGELFAEKRANLQIDVVCEGDDGLPDDVHSNRSFYALNEVAITRGDVGTTIEYSLDISDSHIADVVGDGVIVATSTGSTAYSLAAGGPIVHPSFNGIIVQPLAPHTLTARAVATDPNDVVFVKLSKARVGKEATLFIDGDILYFDSSVKEVYVRRGAEPTTLLYADKDHFYHYTADTFFMDKRI